jgi:predicted N-acetyltransferase YhbS
MKQRGERIVIVVGHPSYYPRFGFSADKAYHSNRPSHRRHSWHSN